MKKIRDCIPTLFSAMIIRSLEVEREWTEKVKKDKRLTKKQKKDAIMLMYGAGIIWAEIFIEGCKQKRSYTIQCMPDGSIIQRFIYKEKRDKVVKWIIKMKNGYTINIG